MVIHIPRYPSVEVSRLEILTEPGGLRVIVSGDLPVIAKMNASRQLPGETRGMLPRLNV